jgi:hypothetical protein
MIQPVESLEITVLVDNGTDSLSTNPRFKRALPLKLREGVWA